MTRKKVSGSHSGILALLIVASLLLSGCGLLFGGEPEPTPTVQRVLVPTFTATPEGQAPTETPLPPTPVPAQEAAQPEPAPPQEEAAQDAPAAEATATPEPSPTPAPKAVLFVEQEQINVRNGPGTDYGLAGSATKGQQFEIVAKNAAGDWWQICCVNGESVWVFGQLARVENTDSVPVAGDVAEPVVVVQPPAATPAPAPQQQPTATPAPPAPTPAPAAADPCANIGGDGCKFKLRDGPKFSPNGGSELKLTLGFIHSGIDGGQPQGSYFVVLLKDGTNLNVPDSVRSFDPSVGSREGPHGKYNYEYKIGLDSIPGSNVAGNYTVFVLDGNGERDSRDFSFTVPDGQGEVYIVFDQG